MTVATVAFGQLQGSSTRERTIATAVDMVRRAAAAGAGLVCFPELANTVYMPFENADHHFAAAEPVTGASVRALQAVAAETGVMVVWPFFECADGRYFNAAAILGVDGRLVGRCRKASVPTSGLFAEGSERYYFSPGDLPYTVWNTPFGYRFGVVICYERNLPEPARCLALDGADLIVVPTATVSVVRPWWELLLRAHAVQNICYVGGCNRVGPDVGGAPDATYFGASVLVDPRGEIVARASDRNEQLLVAELDLGLLAEQRKRWSFFDDRRPELYGAITRPRDG